MPEALNVTNKSSQQQELYILYANNAEALDNMTHVVHNIIFKEGMII